MRGRNPHSHPNMNLCKALVVFRDIHFVTVLNNISIYGNLENLVDNYILIMSLSARQPYFCTLSQNLPHFFSSRVSGGDLLDAAHTLTRRADPAALRTAAVLCEIAAQGEEEQAGAKEAAYSFAQQYISHTLQHWTWDKALQLTLPHHNFMVNLPFHFQLLPKATTIFSLLYTGPKILFFYVK